MNSFHIRALVSGAVALCLAGVTPVIAQQTTFSTAEASALTVSAAKPQTKDWAKVIPASGWLTAWQEAVVASETSGLRVTDVLVDVGSVVSKGQTLATLSQDSVLADLHKQEAAVDIAKANLAEAKANADRARKVSGAGAISDQQANQYLITEQTTTATLASEQAALESEKIKLKQTTIVAADDGIVSSRSATLGTVVSSGTELFRLIRQQRIEWQAEVAAQYLPQIKQGLSAVISGPDNERIEGKVRLVAPTVSTSTGRVIVYVELPALATPRVGLYASGAISLGVTTALTVPETALVFRDGINYLFTVNANNHVTRVRVDVGRRLDGLVEITSGLAADAQVVVAGGAFLSDNAVVKLAEAGQ
jgi:RND family efflux transporter MFP subunit